MKRTFNILIIFCVLALLMSYSGAEIQNDVQNISASEQKYDGFYFSSIIPDGWDIVDQWRINRDMVIIGDGTSAVAITTKKGGTNQTLNSFVEHELSALQVIHPGYASTVSEEVSFLDNPAIKVTGSYTSGGGSVEVTSLYSVMDGMEISLTLLSPPNVSDAPFQKIVESFTLKEIDQADSGKIEIWKQKEDIYSLSYPDILNLVEADDTNTILLKNNANHTVMKVNILNLSMNLDDFSNSIQNKMIQENISILDESRLTIDQNPAELILFKQSTSNNQILKGFEIYIPINDSLGNPQILSIVSAYPAGQFDEIYPIVADIVNSVRIPAKSEDKYWYFDPYEYMSIDDWIEYGILTDYMDYGLDFDLWNYGYGLTFTDADYLEELLGWDNYYLYDTDTSSWYHEYDPTYIADLWSMDPDEYFAADHLVEMAYDDF